MLTSGHKEYFLEEAKKAAAVGNEYQFSLAGEMDGIVECDGCVVFTVGGEEEFVFDTAKEFSQWFFDEDKSVSYIYRYLIGFKNGDGELEPVGDGEYDPIDPDDTGDEVWSAPVRKCGDEIVGSAVKNPTDEMRVMALPIPTEAKREILKECREDAHLLNPMGMVERIVSTYGLNASQLGHAKAIKMVADVYNFSESTIEGIIDGLQIGHVPIFGPGPESTEEISAVPK